MYNSSIGELTSDTGTFIDQWVGKYAYSFRKESLMDIAEELKNNLRKLNDNQEPKIMENLLDRVVNGMYVVNQRAMRKVESNVGHSIIEIEV